MKVCGFCGASGAGKTTLIEGVLRALNAAGQRVSVVKHAGHGFEIDIPGKDSWRMREAGAFEVVIASKNRLAKVREYEVEGEPSVHQMLAELVDVNWVLVEGFKHADLLRIELWRAGGDRPAQYPVDPFVVAIVTDAPSSLPEPTARPVFALDDVAGVAAFLLASGERHTYAHHG